MSHSHNRRAVIYDSQMYASYETFISGCQPFANMHSSPLSSHNIVNAFSLRPRQTVGEVYTLTPLVPHYDKMHRETMAQIRLANEHPLPVPSARPNNADIHFAMTTNPASPMKSHRSEWREQNMVGTKLKRLAQKLHDVFCP